MVLLLVFMQLTRDLFAIAKFLLFKASRNGGLGDNGIRYVADVKAYIKVFIKIVP